MQMKVAALMSEAEAPPPETKSDRTSSASAAPVEPTVEECQRHVEDWKDQGGWPLEDVKPVLDQYT